MDNRMIVRPDAETVGFRELLVEAWAARWIIVGFLCACTITASAAGYLLPKQYRAEVLITATDSPMGASGGLGALAPQYGALASLAGVSVSGKGSKEEAIALLQSRLITQAYVHDNDLLPVIFPDRWDRTSKQWKVSAGDQPSLWLANQYFSKKIRDVKEDKQTGLITLRITWRDPEIAAKWANDLVKVTNRYLRDKAIKEAENNISYLNEQAAKTNVIEAKTAIYSILKEEINKQMIARGREEYALKVLDPAQPPETPSTPSVLLLGVVGLATGLLISALFVWRNGSTFRQGDLN